MSIVSFDCIFRLYQSNNKHERQISLHYKKSLAMKKVITLVICCFCILSVIRAEVRLPHIFSDNMVIQRNENVKIWGWADKGEKITVSFNGQIQKVTANKDGVWNVILKPMKAGGPYRLEVTGKNKVTFDNILIGEVWLCSGQSNMEMPVNGWGQVYNYEEEIASANYPQIRAFNVPQTIGATSQTDFGGQWQVCSPQTVSGFSATAYFFARKLYQELNIPVGIINSSWGGTDIETWISGDKFDMLDKKFHNRYKEFEYIKSNFGEFVKQNEAGEKAYKAALKNDKGLSEEWFKLTSFGSDWKKMTVPQEWSTTELADVDGIVWFAYNFNLPAEAKGKSATLSLGMIDDSDVTWINGMKIGSTDGYALRRNYIVSEGILKEGQNTIVVKVIDDMSGGGIYDTPENLYLTVNDKKYSLAGEWNYRPSVTNKEYNFIHLSPNQLPSLLYNGMINPITDFRIKGTIWYQGENNAGQAYNYRTLFPTLITNWRSKWGYEFPFYWVQLANFMAKDKMPQDSEWAELREAQTMTLNLPNTGQAVITDIGDAGDIHPRNKQDVGKRLALIALNKDYGKKGIVYSGPTFKSVEVIGNKLMIHFDNVAGGLISASKYGYVEGFAIAGADNKFEWAKAYIDGDKVIIYSDKVSNPVNVRYSWSNNPDVNLYNSAGLPAVSFRTDKLKTITEK